MYIFFSGIDANRDASAQGPCFSNMQNEIFPNDKMTVKWPGKLDYLEKKICPNMYTTWHRKDFTVSLCSTFWQTLVMTDFVLGMKAKKELPSNYELKFFHLMWTVPTPTMWKSLFWREKESEKDSSSRQECQPDKLERKARLRYDHKGDPKKGY